MKVTNNCNMGIITVPHGLTPGNNTKILSENVLGNGVIHQLNKYFYLSMHHVMFFIFHLFQVCNCQVK